MGQKYDMTIYAVYVGKDHSVSVFAYPARQRNEQCVECKVYLNKNDAYQNEMIKLPTNEFYKNDFGKTINLVESNVTYFLDKEEAQKCADGKIKKQYKKTCKEIENLEAEILSLQERLFEMQEIKTAHECGVFNTDPIPSNDRKDAKYY